MPFGSVAKSWRRLLIDVAFGRNYPAYFSMSSATVRGAPRNPILDELLPSLLQIKAVAVLDKALRVKLDSDGTTPKAHGFRNDLNGRIETALAVGILKDVSLLHRVRGSRNDVAHEFDEKIDWKQLDRDISTIHLALHEMGLLARCLCST